MKKSGMFLLAVIAISAPLYAKAASIPTHKSLLFVDDYQEGAYPMPDITDKFRTPTIGLSAAWYEGCEWATAKLANRLDGMAVEVNVPRDAISITSEATSTMSTISSSVRSGRNRIPSPN